MLGGDSGHNHGGDSGLTTSGHAIYSLVRGGTCPEVLGRNFCSMSQGGDSGHLGQRLRRPEVSFRRLKAEVPASKGCNGWILDRGYINEPFLPGGVSWLAYPLWISYFSLVH